MQEKNNATLIKAQEIENEINKIFIRNYNLDEYSEIVKDRDDITLYINLKHLYGSDISDNIRQNRYFSDQLSEMMSYSIGCMMGRYSLDREGLVYAHEGNKGFSELVAEGAYKTFPADSDGILPLMDDEWFDDDVTSRVKEFVRTVWGEEHLQENLEFIAESLCLYAIKPKKANLRWRPFAAIFPPSSGKII